MKFLLDTNIIIDHLREKEILKAEILEEDGGISIINLDKEIINEFAKIKAYLEKAGQRLEDFDLLIAATALVNKLILVTRNIKHFNRIEGLKIHN